MREEGLVKSVLVMMMVLAATLVGHASDGLPIVWQDGHFTRAGDGFLTQYEGVW